MSSTSSTAAHAIPILLLKTRSQPDDTYEEHFSGPKPAGVDASIIHSFSPAFVPVLEHTPNARALSHLGNLLRTGELKRRYGGMIYTSQRAVEAWAEVVHAVENDPTSQRPSQRPQNDPPDPFADMELLTPFPIYVVGPATERALTTLTSQSTAVPHSPFNRLNPSIYGAHTGNGANLAAYILRHYEQLQREHHFTYFEAPRLPFIPLLGMSSQNYGRKRLEKDDPRLKKKPLLFLVGEVRRDVIPRTLAAAEDRIEVEEVEVYATRVMSMFQREFEGTCRRLDEKEKDRVRVVVVFSPQGSDIMLRGIGYLDENARPTERARKRWWQDGGAANGHARWVVVTIGPTTRDYLRDRCGIEPDASAEKPSPEGLRKEIEEFLNQKNVTL
ncbi:hypothetical protein LTR70_002387 [Exophiala xenobiotica]|uniref:Tetrapyrrole biosynthesis uroporphyrinogen III synthase domain-containing protein n=1 Tax=Lithohypha guttulata TaxID=1690604 RepID=A0ABR0KLS2_9EURO|nr:hypothetical protein LTR24_001384 [Lithohypha guttulata]KAK5325415.1 hypothetical protein LTR70_002387 [Exophiala xenobiotica]